MNEIQIFNNPEFGDVRTVMIDGEPWFVGKDVANALGYVRTNSMLKLVDNDDKRNISSSDLEQQVYSQNYTVSVVNESGLYAAIFGSKMESAKKFKKWVTSEVLPQLRKTGSYGTPQIPTSTADQIRLLAQGTTELNQRVDTLQDRMDKLEMDLPLLPIEAERITAAVQRRGVTVLGGKHSQAYHNRAIRQRVYNNLYANLKYNFGIRSYKALKRSQTDAAVEIVRRYEPPFFLAEEIRLENAEG